MKDWPQGGGGGGGDGAEGAHRGTGREKEEGGRVCLQAGRPENKTSIKMTRGGLALLALLKLIAASTSSEASSACAVVKVTGGVAPGSYALSTVLQSAGARGGGDVYEQAGPGGETAAVLLFTQGTSAGEAVEAGSGYWGQVAHRPRSGRRGDRLLSECAAGFWINHSGDGRGSTTTVAAAAAAAAASSSSSSSSSSSFAAPDVDSVVVYPVYAASDCASHPTEITADWFSVGCAACELELSEALVIECDDNYEAGGDTGSHQPTPSPSGGAPGSDTSSPSPGVPTGSPATAGTPSPAASTGSPGVVPDEAATRSPSSDAPEPAGTVLPATAAPVIPTPVPTPVGSTATGQPVTPSPSDGESADSSSTGSNSTSSSSNGEGGGDASPVGSDSRDGVVEGEDTETSGAGPMAAGGSGAGGCAAAVLLVVSAVMLVGLE
eukprot:g3559.t2